METYNTAGRFPRLINCTDGQLSTQTQSSCIMKSMNCFLLNVVYINITVVKRPVDELSSCLRYRLSSNRRLSTFCEVFNVDAIN